MKKLQKFHGDECKAYEAATSNDIWQADTSNVMRIKVNNKSEIVYLVQIIDDASRLIVGQDILSSNEGLAIFSNRSWTSDYGTYFSKENKFIPKEGKEIEEGYVKRINNIVANRFTMSNLFIKYDIYNKI